MNILIALIVFELLVVFHEFGHFIAARACGVKVVEFSVGMGPKLFSVQGKDTLFSLRGLPIGGYCSMVGEDEEDEGDVEGSLASKPVWQRMLVLFAGPFFNFLLAFLLAGAAGNLIDRAFRQSVVDFIYFKPIDFPVFNVADIYVTCSTFVMVILILRYYEDEDFAFLSLKKVKTAGAEQQKTGPEEKEEQEK